MRNNTPEVFFYRQDENNGLSSIELYLLYTNPTSTTVIHWNNGISPDTLRGDVAYDKQNHRVALKKLYLNGDLVWTDEEGDNRHIVIKKKDMNL